MPSWIKEYELLSGMAIVLLTSLGFIIKRIFFRSKGTGLGASSDPIQSITINNSNLQGASSLATPASARRSLERQHVRILFVDDDKKFKVVRIIKNANWPCVEIKRDIKDLDAHEVREVDIFFIDIQGVGKALGFADEGLGLALAIKKKYPDKKVVIYSAQTTGERFHPALKEADAMLAKNAEPYEFIALLERLAGI